MPEESLIQLGTLGILFALMIKELFGYLRSRKENGNGNGLDKAIFGELQRMNNNHLHTIQGAIEEGNRRLIDTIHNDNTKIIELLAEIKGALHK